MKEGTLNEHSLDSVYALITPLIIYMINESIYFYRTYICTFVAYDEVILEFQSKQNSAMTNLNASDWPLHS